MTDFDSSAFDERCDRCTPSTRQIVEFLRTVAEHAGPDVEPPTFEVRGVGVTYWVAGRRFCRFDPKEDAGHVWAFVPGGDRAELETAGAVSPRDDGPWLTVKDMTGAVRLVPEVLRAYRPGTRRSAQGRGVSTVEGDRRLSEVVFRKM